MTKEQALERLVESQDRVIHFLKLDIARLKDEKEEKEREHFFLGLSRGMDV